MFGPCSSAQPCTDLDVDLLGGRVGAGPAQPGPLHPLTDLVEVEGGAEAPGNTVVVHEIKSSRWDTETGERPPGSTTFRTERTIPTSSHTPN